MLWITRAVLEVIYSKIEHVGSVSLRYSVISETAFRSRKLVSCRGEVGAKRRSKNWVLVSVFDSGASVSKMASKTKAINLTF
jgi:hypothetical protein